MNKPLAIQLEFDIKTVRRALAILTGEVMSDEEINAKFFDREPVKVDAAELFGESESLQISAGFLSIIMDEGKPYPKPGKSKFQQKLDEMAAKHGK